MMTEQTRTWQQTTRKETMLFLLLLLVGLLLLPGVIYVIGRTIFGEYGGSGFSAFYGALHSDLRSGQTAAWFLVLSPYLVWQLMRLTFHSFRAAGGR